MIRIFDFFRSRRQKPAVVAKERLQILLAHERSDRDRPDFLPSLQKDILEVVARYLVIDQDKVLVKLERGKELSVLEVNIELPGPTVPLTKAAREGVVATPPAKAAGDRASGGAAPDKAAEPVAAKTAEAPVAKQPDKPAETIADKAAAAMIDKAGMKAEGVPSDKVPEKAPERVERAAEKAERPEKLPEKPRLAAHDGGPKLAGSPA